MSLSLVMCFSNITFTKYSKRLIYNMTLTTPLHCQNFSTVPRNITKTTPTYPSWSLPVSWLFSPASFSYPHILTQTLCFRIVTLLLTPHSHRGTFYIKTVLTQSLPCGSYTVVWGQFGCPLLWESFPDHHPPQCSPNTLYLLIIVLFCCHLFIWLPWGPDLRLIQFCIISSCCDVWHTGA